MSSMPNRVSASDEWEWAEPGMYRLLTFAPKSKTAPIDLEGGDDLQQTETAA